MEENKNTEQEKPAENIPEVEHDEIPFANEDNTIKEKNTNPWPAELDALIAAPQHHKLLFENERVRVLDTHIPAGEQTNIHTHQNPASLYILSWSDFIRYDATGNVLVDSRTLAAAPLPGAALWSEPLAPHALKNIGDKDLHVISMEIKQTEK